MNIYSKKVITLALILIVLFTSCEEAYFPPTLDGNQQFVVEGFIEAGENAGPTFILLTKSIPFITKVDRKTFENIFVKGAAVTVSDGKNIVALTELCLNQLPPELKKQAAEVLGLNADSLQADICLYADLFNQIKPKVGGKYDLKVVVGGQTLTATTTIPPHVKVDSLVWKVPPGKPIDSLARLWINITDRKEKDLYRVQIGINGGNLLSGFNSVTDDGFFNGKSFEFPLDRPQARGESFDAKTAGLFKRGDSITLKWMNIDQAHFDFWNTRDFSANSGGPFSSYTRIKTNINGGLGIWGGISVSYYESVVPK